MNPEALIHLRKHDRVLRKLVDRVGPCQLTPQPRRTPFQSLATAIAHQQLNGRAAETILGRFRALFPGRRFPRPADLPSVSDVQLRGAGFSRAKVAALRDLAAKSVDGTLPTGRTMRGLDDEAIVEQLSQVRGIGRWTVEMLLIFQLGRPDVLPADDFGVRNGFRLTFKLSALPSRQQLLDHGDKWRPYRTTAAWYLWRAVDLVAAPQLSPPE